MAEQVEFYDLIEVRKRISKIQDSIILINSKGSIRFLGPIVVDHIFKILKLEFNIEKEIFRVDDDIAGLFYAMKKNYRNILYTGPSNRAKKLLAVYNT